MYTGDPNSWQTWEITVMIIVSRARGIIGQYGTLGNTKLPTVCTFPAAALAPAAGQRKKQQWHRRSSRRFAAVQEDVSAFFYHWYAYWVAKKLVFRDKKEVKSSSPYSCKTQLLLLQHGEGLFCPPHCQSWSQCMEGAGWGRREEGDGEERVGGWGALPTSILVPPLPLC